MTILVGLFALALQAAQPAPPQQQSAATPAAAASQTFGDTEYQLGPEDVISVFVWKQPDLSTTVVIRPDRKISLPLVGEIEAAGKTSVQLQNEIGTRLKEFVVEPHVTVIVKEINSPVISVLGQVRKPDRYHIRQRITALDAIAMAGGFTEFAKRDKITIIRNGASDKSRIQVDLKKVVNGHGEVYYLEPLDTIYVQ